MAVFAERLEELLEDRGIDGTAELATRLQDAGYPFTDDHIVHYSELAAKDPAPEGSHVLGGAVADVLGLSKAEKAYLTHAYPTHEFVMDERPPEEISPSR
jgi:hypothetical protein